MSAPGTNRKPHLLRAKQEIVAILDNVIRGKVESLAPDDKDAARDLAIFIRQRNKIARDADVKEMPLVSKDHQGRIIYEV